MIANLRIPFADAVATGGIERGLRVAGEHILGESNQHVPHEYGDLERTGAADVDGDTLYVSYSDADYPGQAADQHENLEYHHDEGRNAKFLENAMNSQRETALKIVATSVARALAAS